MHWTDLPGSELISRVFSQPPKIEGIDFFGMDVSREGPTVTLHFDMVGNIPDKPPVKWGREFNRCRIGLYCFGVSELSVSGVSTEMLANINIYLDGEAKKVIIKNNSTAIYIECSHISLTGPSVYCSK